jgi:hypothetical protein
MRQCTPALACSFVVCVPAWRFCAGRVCWAAYQRALTACSAPHPETVAATSGSTTWSLRPQSSWAPHACPCCPYLQPPGRHAAAASAPTLAATAPLAAPGLVARSFASWGSRPLQAAGRAAAPAATAAAVRPLSVQPEAAVYMGPAPRGPSRVTLRTLRKKYDLGEPLSMVTAYDYPSAVHVRPCAGRARALLAMLAWGRRVGVGGAQHARASSIRSCHTFGHVWIGRCL